MSDIGDKLRIAELESQVRELQSVLGMCRQVIMSAICSVCAEEIGEEKIGEDAEGRLCHERCGSEEEFDTSLAAHVGHYGDQD